MTSAVEEGEESQTTECGENEEAGEEDLRGWESIDINTIVCVCARAAPPSLALFTLTVSLITHTFCVMLMISLGSVMLPDAVEDAYAVDELMLDDMSSVDENQEEDAVSMPVAVAVSVAAAADVLELHVTPVAVVADDMSRPQTSTHTCTCTCAYTRAIAMLQTGGVM